MNKVLGVLLVGLLSLGVFAGDGKRAVEPQVAHQNTQKVLGQITWHASLDAALEKAKAENKLVFWMQLKGELSGFV